MKKDQDIVRCTNCWEGFDWQQIQAGERSGECPRCGRGGRSFKAVSLSLLWKSEVTRKTMSGKVLNQERGVSRTLEVRVVSRALKPNSNNAKQMKI
jgi:hypothetical protein